MQRSLIPWLAVFCCLSEAVQSTPSAFAQPMYRTVTYDVADLLRPEVIEGLGNTERDAREVAGEKLVKLVTLSVAPEKWASATGGESTIELLQGTKLVVRTTPDIQEQIGDLLQQLRKLVSISVQLEVELYEVPSVVFKKTIEPLLSNGGFVVEGEKTPALVRMEMGTGHKINTSVSTTPSVIFSRKRTFTYREKLSDFARKPENETGAGFHGATCRAAVTMSGDYSTAYLTLTREVSELIAIKTQSVTCSSPIGPGLETREVPEIREEKQTTHLQLPNNGQFLVVIPPTSRLEKESSKISLLLIRVHIPKPDGEDAIPGVERNPALLEDDRPPGK